MTSVKKQSNSYQSSLIKEKQTGKEAFRNIRNYLAGQFVGATRDDMLLDEVLKCLFCKLLMERGETQTLESFDDTFKLAKQLRTIFNSVREEFADIFPSSTEIMLDPTSLSYVMRQLDFSIMDAKSDPIGDAFEVFVGSESKGNSGQFFTPRSVTSLLVKAIDPKPNETVLDPACGAGGFLSSVCAHLEKNGVTPKEITHNLYGIDKDAYLAQLARVHIALLTGGHTRVINGDSISLKNGGKSVLDYLPKGGVDVILTNPPFGVRIIAASSEVLETFELAHNDLGVVKNNVPPQVLFVERCISLLKPGGRLGIVLPESILSNKTYKNVTEYLLKNTEIHAILGMPEALFKTSGKGGTHTKTCLVVATKKGIKSSNKKDTVFMAEAKWCGQDSRARNIPNNDLPIIAENFIAYKNNSLEQQSSLGFSVNLKNVNGGVLCPRYYDVQAQKELIGLEKTHDLVTISQLTSEGVISINTGDEIGKLAYGTGDIPFIRTSDISNWELKADPKHGVSREIYSELKNKQDIQPGDILMVKDGTYLIGTCAIVSKADKELIYQSHLYKIRVNKNKYGLDPYYLLAILTSTVVQKQIRSKQFTQDIIDSLGGRIYELVLPITKNKDDRDRISNLVEQAVSKRAEARELAKEARRCVAL